MPFKKGEGGRPPGAQNRLTQTVKETVLNVFNELQDDKGNNLKAFAKKYPRDFYAIAAKLIPTEIHARLNKVTLEIVRTTTTPANLLTNTTHITTNGVEPGEEV